jgi:CheY-like chemotaxis protein
MAKIENNTNDAKKIMIVDDEPDVISVLEFVLNENGFEVDSFIDPTAALKNYRVGICEILKVLSTSTKEAAKRLSSKTIVQHRPLTRPAVSLYQVKNRTYK